MSDYPTPWQRKMIWAAVTAFCVVLLVVIVGTVIWTGANILSFLQPILIPVAIAGILTYLLDPLVTKMSRGTLSRTKAVVLLFAIAFFALGGLLGWLIPSISIQSANFAKQVPAYTEKARDRIVDLIYRFDQTFGVFGGVHGKSASTSLTNLLIGPSSPSPQAQPTATASRAARPEMASPSETIAPIPSKLTTAERQRIQAYVEKQIPTLQRCASHARGKVLGNPKAKHRRISWSHRFFAQSYPGADLFIFLVERAAAHRKKMERLSSAPRVTIQRRSRGSLVGD